MEQNVHNCKKPIDIYDWMNRHKHLRSGCIIREGLTNAWGVSRQTPSHVPVEISNPYGSDYSNEYKFEWEPTTAH